ncbi:hypothetical protein [Pseudomonas aeruginosa]|uniref:hypothetical protein n=1 Tax=Pseudomonas aeruginosa TaxID=287 RepID=UPI000E314C36|nr:hypothetical protein [Pseudomonas aeruginosa]MBG3901740.1 hypothetical protein [Pseudomonas aeruginosa]NQC04669.1 hypothetical protein [Pseudomonas aeruginosa]RTT87082.1 hypothetical protein DY963_19425 [Pseudomonas aeruginosa]HBO9153612.1 hypothetical protein [Pseudomonas aeruginosa]
MLRKKIIDYMRTVEPGRSTWWFRRHIYGYDTPEILRELKRMEREGLVTADRSQPNNTKWKLSAAGKEVGHE